MRRLQRWNLLAGNQWLTPVILATVLMPGQANSSWDPILKNPLTKKGWWSDSRYRPWVQTLVLQKKPKRWILLNKFLGPEMGYRVCTLSVGVEEWNSSFNQAN
jgi:hypothetical protein